MGLLSFLKGQKLKPAWSIETERASEVIWKLLISPSGILAGEERDIETKTASLFAIDVRTGRQAWRDVRLEESWWFGSERATETNLYIHSFRKPDLPEPQGITAVNIETGDIRWRQPELTFLFEFENLSYVYRQGFSHREYFALSAKTGEIVESFGEETNAVLGKQSQLPDHDPMCFYANSLDLESKYFQIARSLIESSLNINDIRGSIEYLEFSNYLIFSYHVRSTSGADAMLRNSLSNELLVVEKSTGDILFRETLHSETPLALPDNFFVAHHTLIYVKEKRTVAGVRLP